MNRRDFIATSCAAVAAPLARTVDAAQSRPAGQPQARTLTEQEVMDVLLGSSIQSTRNSDTAGMQKRAREMLAAGRTFQLVSLESVPDDWNVICAAGGIGGGGAWEHVRERM